jgi:hypothetical protein
MARWACDRSEAQVSDLLRHRIPAMEAAAHDESLLPKVPACVPETRRLEQELARVAGKRSK